MIDLAENIWKGWNQDQSFTRWI